MMINCVNLMKDLKKAEEKYLEAINRGSFLALWNISFLYEGLEDFEKAYDYMKMYFDQTNDESASIYLRIFKIKIHPQK